MARDYKSFSSAAKSRFRGMAKALGYEQLTGVFYVKNKGEWYESFGLQASTYGNDFFYINYGVIVPNLWDPFEDAIDLKSEGYILSLRLHDEYSQGFPNENKDAIVKSADTALLRYKEQALPWFEQISSLEDIAEKYFETTHLNKDRLGEHDYFLQLSAANYGLLLRLATKSEESLNWLKEAERLMALPVYFTKDGRTVHEREKYSRISKPDKYEIARHKTIKAVIEEMQAD